MGHFYHLPIQNVWVTGFYSIIMIIINIKLRLIAAIPRGEEPEKTPWSSLSKLCLNWIQ